MINHNNPAKIKMENMVDILNMVSKNVRYLISEVLLAQFNQVLENQEKKVYSLHLYTQVKAIPT